MLSNQSGFQNLLKEGHRHFGGLEESILKNIGACKDISNMTRTSLGPNGMKKMVINHIEKIFVTSDAATIMKELEVQHPAAKMVVMAAKMQENECGDASNFVVTFAGELLEQAENLIKMGLHPSQIISGYEAANKMVPALLDELISFKLNDLTTLSEVKKGIRSSLSSKILGYSDLFSGLVAEACIACLPKNPKNFDVDHVRVCKILGSHVNESHIVKGVVVNRNAEGSIKYAENPKIAVYGCPFDTQQADTKGTVLIKNAKELMNYTKSEEEHAESIVKEIADKGVNVIVAGGSISEIMMHYVEKYKMMVVRIMSKFELRRISRCLGATALVRLGAPTAEEMGTASEVRVIEVGSEKITLFKRETEDCRLATIILRGSSKNLLDDLERAIDDAVNNYRNAIRDCNFVPGAGTTEIQLAQKLEVEGSKITGLDQYSFNKYANSFEIFPRILIENSGMKVNENISKLHSLNLKEPHGIDIENCKISPSSELNVYDHLQTKLWAIRLATDAAITVLRVDQIIVSKPAGGPKPKENKNWDED